MVRVLREGDARAKPKEELAMPVAVGARDRVIAELARGQSGIRAAGANFACRRGSERVQPGVESAVSAMGMR